MKKKSRNHYNIPIFIPHEGCPHGCIFCNQKKITGVETSVTPQDAEKIIEEYLSYIPKTAEHIEAAFFGGSFTGLDLITQEAFLKTAAKPIKIAVERNAGYVSVYETKMNTSA